MELELKFAELACCEPVGDLVTTQEESMETAIPEYCPDIARIVDTVGQLRLREKHPAGQQLTMGGSVVLTVLYTSEESAGLRSLSMEVPFSCQVEDKRLADCDAVCVTGRLLLAEDGEFLRGLADDLEAGTPAQALAELFTRLLQEDMPTLQKYEKRLTALEEALMQDQAQDLDKKLFRIRRELSVFAAYYEQLDDLFAVLSEIPFDLMYGGTWFYPFHQNVIWTLLIGLAGIHLMEKDRKKQKLWIFLPTAVLVVLVGSALGTVGMADYYGAGVLTLFIFYFFRGRKWWCFSGQLLALYWVNVELLGGLMYPIRLFGMDLELCQQGLALLSLLPIWLYRGRQGCHTKVFQYSCYAFYPVHMLILALVLNYVNR